MAGTALDVKDGAEPMALNYAEHMLVWMDRESLTSDSKAMIRW
jgi:hypothetical protein